MKILIIHLGNIRQLIPATSVIKGIKKKIKNSSISWVVDKKEYKYMFKFNRLIDEVMSLSELKGKNETFDFLINLYPKLNFLDCLNVKVLYAFDYNFNNEFKDFIDVINGEESNYNMNIFQMYYRLAGLTWRGEGYELGYYPRSKSKSNRMGLAVANANLRNYVHDNLLKIDSSNKNKIQSMKLWHIPYKKNIFKRMDEINKCNKIITDDLTTFHLSMYLRKYVYFLETIPLNIKLEFFNNGEIYKVPKTIIQ